MQKTALDALKGSSVMAPAFLEQQLNSSLKRFRCPVQRETVLDDFQAAIDRFLLRTAASSVTREKQDGVMAAVHRLLSAEQSPIRYSDRFILACQILSHAAAPETVSCGGFRTSAAAALEYLLYVQEPQLAAQIVADMAIQGQWKAASDALIKAHRLNLLAIYDADVTLVPNGESRSYASQMVQLALTNEMLAQMPGHLRYVMLKSTAEAGASTGGASVGSRFDAEPGSNTDVSVVMPKSTTIEALFGNGRFVERFTGIALGHVNRAARALLGRDAVMAHFSLCKGDDAIQIFNEVQLYDLLADNAPNPLLAVVLNEANGTKVVVINCFDARTGISVVWDARNGGQLRDVKFLDLYDAMHVVVKVK